MICYGLLGIPLFLLAIAKFSSVLADLFIFIYRYIVCCPCECISAYYVDNRTHAVDEENDVGEGSRTNMSQVFFFEIIVVIKFFFKLLFNLEWIVFGKRRV